MIIQKSFPPKIPSYRHKVLNKIQNLSFFFKKQQKTIKNNSLLRKKKRLYSTFKYTINNKLYKYVNLTTTQVVYNIKPYKQFFICKTPNNFYKILPGIEYLNVGKPIFSYNYLIKDPFRMYFRGVLVTLNSIPLTCFISNISNKWNTKITYAKAGGTFCKTQKSKKSKKKLILIILPSKIQTYLPKYCTGYIGKNTNFKIHKLTEGSWGYGLHECKRINVRGVAMNPVDHPNGGRTKTVQPERSPWNWVAKQKK